MALDELSRGARSWHGAMPEQMTAHTELKDDRSAGFLHFKLNRKSDCTRLHLLIPDLPGEWSTDLIDNNRKDRVRFLRAADVIWVMINGQTLIKKDQRPDTLHRTSLLIDRIAEFFSPDIPTVRLVVTHMDLGKPGQESLQNSANMLPKTALIFRSVISPPFRKTMEYPLERASQILWLRRLRSLSLAAISGLMD